ncbi:MAG: hypothetical protein E7675_07940 [Ruminococcaceae bacterium]|nr:hypothetical protein [Oscillospiraceae bacterium]
MKKRIISLVLLTVMALGALGLTSCNAKTPDAVWKKGIASLSKAEIVSFNTEVIYGENNIKMEVVSDRETQKRSYSVSISEDEFVLYTNGSKNFYTVEDMSFSIDSSEDSDIFREFLGFTLSNAERMTFDKKDLVDAVLTENEDSKSVDFKVSGDAFKAAFAPDEEITFSEVTVNSVLDLDNNFKSIKVTTTVCGNDFYGIPLIGAVEDPVGILVSIDGIDLAKSKTPVEPKDESEYQESVLLAKIFPTSVFSMLNPTSKEESTSKMEMTIAGQTIKNETKTTTTTEIIDGDVFLRVITDSTQWQNGNKQVDQMDEYYDGDKGYLYYSDYSTKYKMKVDEEDVLGAEITDETFSELKDIMSEANVKDDVITLKLSLADLKKIVGEEEFENSFGGAVTLEEANLKIKLSGGFVESLSFDFEIKVVIEGLTAAVEMEMETKQADIREIHKVTPPKNYEHYPKLF